MGRQLSAIRVAEVERGQSAHLTTAHLLCAGESYVKQHVRRKRATPNRNTCTLLLVADHKFHRIVGEGSVTTTANYLVSVCVCACVCACV